MEDSFINDKEYWKIRKHINKFSEQDLRIWQNEMLNGGKTNNRLFELIDSELKRRRIATLKV